MWEEAAPGCPRRCRSVSLDEPETDDGAVELAEIERFVDEHRVFPLSLNDLDYWQSEGVIYWLKTEKDFETRNLTILRMFAEGFGCSPK